MGWALAVDWAPKTTAAHNASAVKKRAQIVVKVASCFLFLLIY